MADGKVELPDEKELMEWAKKHYPEFAHDLELMKLLWLKLHNKNTDGERQRRYKRKKIGEVVVGEYVEVECVVIEYLGTTRYEGCSVCRRKKCDCNADRKEYVSNWYEVADDTGRIIVSVDAEKEDKIGKIEVGCVVVLRGKVKEYRGKLEMVVFDFEIKRQKPKVEDGKKEKAKKVIDELKSLGEIEKDLLMRYFERRGLTWEDVEEFLDVKEVDGKEVVVFDGDGDESRKQD